MTAARAARIAHQWLALVVGAQLILWTASGVYMTAVDLDFIHGDHLVRNLASPLDLDRARLTPSQVRDRYPDLRRATLRALPDGSIAYQVEREAGIVLVDALDGGALARLPEARVAVLAKAYYAGTGALARVTLIERDPPSELQGRKLPLWRADFDDWMETSLYIDARTGRLVARRHVFWRWFDFLWSLHIMDYRERSDVNNTLLRVTTVASLALVASGLWLVAYAFRWGRGRKRRS